MGMTAAGLAVAGPAAASSSSIPKLTLTATMGLKYSRQLTVTVKASHRKLVRWVDVKNLPPGLTLSSRGLISGKPTKVGSWTTTYGVRLTTRGSKTRTGVIAWTVKTPTLAQQLVSAPVPSLCGHHAGHLVDGKLPGIPKGKGRVFLDRSADGTITGVDGPAAVATLGCDIGGVDWPRTLAIYGAGPTLLAYVNLGDVTIASLGSGEYTVPTSLKISGGKVQLDWLTEQKGDPDSETTLSYSASFTRDGSKVVVSDLVGTTEVPTATAFRDAVAAGDQSKAASVSSAAIAKTAIAGTSGHTIGTVSCHAGAGYPYVPSSYPKSSAPADRWCTASVSHGKAMYYGLKMSSFRHWKVSWVNVVD